MSDSLTTKLSLSNSLKKLMETLPFEKITASMICANCGMNRKSLYYHFKDKYDLINWIFDTEFPHIEITSFSNSSYEQKKHYMLLLCTYLYENRTFYRKAFKIKDQNSLSNHLRGLTRNVLTTDLSSLSSDVVKDDFALEVLTDTVFLTIERWITASKCMPPDEFIEKLFYWVEFLSESVYKNKPQ